jgi:hypothetical protein
MKQRILLNDTFDGTNSTALTSHYPNKCHIPANIWATISTHTIHSIQSNAASAGADATSYTSVIDIGRPHIFMEADLRAGATSGATNYITFLMRLYDVSNYYGVQVGETSSASFNLNLIERIAGTSTTIATRSVTFSDSTAYNIKIWCQGNLLKVAFNDGGAEISARLNKWFAPGTYVGFTSYIAATSTAYPLVYNIKVLG